jgi:hypothetical protein
MNSQGNTQSKEQCWRYHDTQLHHPWDEANLVVMNDLSDVLSDSACHYFIEGFCIDVH